MKYLVKLIIPNNGIILDCFAGSGSTLIAAIHEKFHFIGIEREAEYIAIAQKRIEHAIRTVGNNTQQINNASQHPTTQPINTKPDIVHQDQQYHQSKQKQHRKPKQAKQDNGIQQISLWNDEVTA